MKRLMLMVTVVALALTIYAVPTGRSHGDEVVDAGEQCGDANLVNGDPGTLVCGLAIERTSADAVCEIGTVTVVGAPTRRASKAAGSHIEVHGSR